MEIKSLSQEHIIYVTDQPEESGSLLVIQIDLPQGVILDHIELKCQTTTSTKIAAKEYLVEANIIDLSETHKLILDAYIQYLQRERQIDVNLGLDAILKTIKQAQAVFEQHRAVSELLHAKMNNATFH